MKMENAIKEAEDLTKIQKVESAAQSIGLFLNAAKTNIMTLNRTSETVYILLMTQRLRNLKTSRI